MMALPAVVPPARARARAALSDPAQVARANPDPATRLRFTSLAGGAHLAGREPVLRLMPGFFLVCMFASLIWLALSHHLIAGVAASACACLSVASDLLSERRSRAAREPS